MAFRDGAREYRSAQGIEDIDLAIRAGEAEGAAARAWVGSQDELLRRKFFFAHRRAEGDIVQVDIVAASTYEFKFDHHRRGIVHARECDGRLLPIARSGNVQCIGEVRGRPQLEGGDQTLKCPCLAAVRAGKNLQLVVVRRGFAGKGMREAQLLRGHVAHRNGPSNQGIAATGSGYIEVVQNVGVGARFSRCTGAHPLDVVPVVFHGPNSVWQRILHGRGEEGAIGGSSCGPNRNQLAVLLHAIACGVLDLQFHIIYPRSIEGEQRVGGDDVLLIAVVLVRDGVMEAGERLVRGQICELYLLAGAQERSIYGEIRDRGTVDGIPVHPREGQISRCAQVAAQVEAVEYGFGT